MKHSAIPYSPPTFVLIPLTRSIMASTLLTASSLLLDEATPLAKVFNPAYSRSMMRWWVRNRRRRSS